MDIHVNVINQELKVATNLKERLAEGSQNFVRFVFNLLDDWEGLTTFAQFVQGDDGYNQYLDENNSVYLPAEIESGTCYLILYGTGGDVVATTNCLELTVNETGFVGDAHSTVITPSLYEQLVAVVERLEEEMEDIVISGAQSDWDVVDSSDVAFIKNKPDVLSNRDIDNILI